MMEREGTLLKLELQLCAHCTPVGDDATLSLDIEKMRSRMLPEPRERYHSAHYYCYYYCYLCGEDKGS